MHATINEMEENLWSTGYLYGNVHAGSGKMQERENHVDDMQMRQTDESWWMSSQLIHTKTITQIDHTTESHGIG